MTTLRNKHLKPIVAIARATMSGLPGIDKALRMPPTCGVTRLVAEATAIAEKRATVQQIVRSRTAKP